MITRHEPAAEQRTQPDINRCNACTGKPNPTYVVYDLPQQVGRSVACSDPVVCRLRAEALGIWRTAA